MSFLLLLNLFPESAMEPIVILINRRKRGNYIVERKEIRERKILEKIVMVEDNRGKR